MVQIIPCHFSWFFFLFWFVDVSWQLEEISLCFVPKFYLKGKIFHETESNYPTSPPPPLPSCPGLEKNFERNSFPFSWHCSYSTHEFHVAICLYVYSTTFQMNHDLKMSLMSIKMRVLLLFSLSFNIHSVISSPNTYCWLVFSRLDTASLSLHRLPCALFGS